MRIGKPPRTGDASVILVGRGRAMILTLGSPRTAS
jgi:hypothetical protein